MKDYNAIRARIINVNINVSAFDIESIGRNLYIFFRWKNAVLQMLETWLSKERLLLNSTPRFITDDEESTEQPSSVRQCSRLLHAEVFGLINIVFLYRLCIPLVSQFGVFHRAVKKYRSEYHQHNSES